MKKYDIGIFGWWYNFNYGANLSYYALNRALTSLGYSVVMLWRSSAIQGTVQMEFAEKYYHISEKYNYQKELEKYNDVCDAFVLGSDQMWNPDLEKYTGDQFFLSFADDGHRRFAYAQSFGEDRALPSGFSEKYNKQIKRFTNISVREDYAVQMCSDIFGIDVERVCDPVFLLKKEQYNELIKNADIDLPTEYVLSFFLDPNKNKMHLAKHIRSNIGIHTYLNFTDLEKPESLVELFDGEQVEINSKIENLVKAISKARFIITDSFHGTCLSIIFNKPFISVANELRGVGRAETLLKRFGLEDRLIYSPNLENMNQLLDKGIDYSYVNQIINDERIKGMQWLESSLYPIRFTTVATELSQELCSGCGACVSSCPKKAITPRADKWGYYRALVDYEKCINCGECVKICPALQLPENGNNENPVCFEYVASDATILQDSSSGAVFSSLANTVLSEGGVVVGAAWRNDFSVDHIIVDNLSDLYKLRKSKYIQSYIGDIFLKIKKYLEVGRRVAFSGTPCQVAGLHAFLRHEYKNLLTIDLLCSYAPSAKLFKMYINDTFGGALQSYQFRYKTREIGWDCAHIQAIYEDGRDVILEGTREDDFQRVYHNHTMCPKHCEQCKYQTFPRWGDLTIGDFWGIGQYDKETSTRQGVSLVLCNNEKGRTFFEDIKSSEYSVRKQVPLQWMGGNGHSLHGGKNWCSPQRDIFYKAILKMGFKDAVNYALKPNHGQYRKIYHTTNSPLQFDVNMLHFHFDKNYWEEIAIEGRTTLIVRNHGWEKIGRYARLSLAGMLSKTQKYRISVKFKIKSASNTLFFHVIDSGSNQLQVIHKEKIAGRNNGEHWIECYSEFYPDADYYDEFMIGASQISGINNYLTFAFINISEV